MLAFARTPILQFAPSARSYMYLGVALARLEDHENAGAAYKKAIAMDPAEPLFRLNYGKAGRLGGQGELVRASTGPAMCNIRTEHGFTFCSSSSSNLTRPCIVHRMCLFVFFCNGVMYHIGWAW